MEVILKGEAKEIAALVLAVQERQSVGTPEKEMAKSVAQELNRMTQRNGKPVLLI